MYALDSFFRCREIILYTHAEYIDGSERILKEWDEYLRYYDGYGRKDYEREFLEYSLDEDSLESLLPKEESLYLTDRIIRMSNDGNYVLLETQEYTKWLRLSEFDILLEKYIKRRVKELKRTSTHLKEDEIEGKFKDSRTLDKLLAYFDDLENNDKLKKFWEENDEDKHPVVKVEDSNILRGERNKALLTKSKTAVSDNTIATIIAIVEKHFPNGIRPGSIIDTNKLKTFYFATTGEALPSEIEISSLLYEIGIQHKDKVFIIASNGKKDLTKLLNGLIDEDNRLFFYEEFYNAHAIFLQEIHIFSPELLKTVLSGILPALQYSRIFFSIDDGVTAESEVLRCFETAVCLSYEQLKTRLPYVPIDKIKQVLAQNRDFIWVNTGIYTHTSKLKIDDVEQRAIEQRIKCKIADQGYVSLANIDVLNNFERNPELSETAVKNGMFQICLADRYEKRGNIITSKGAVLNSVAVFKDYCLSRKRVMLDELIELEEVINGRVNSQSLFVAYDTMIRIDKRTFVGDDEIRFDIEAVDAVLGLFVREDVIPLQAVTSFTSFPYINGYSWNLYLIESYCKRFSKRFMYQCLSVNSSNVGAIFQRSACFTDYAEVLAAVVANAGIELDTTNVGNFLFDSGYIARRTSVISDVITKAQVLRERQV